MSSNIRSQIMDTGLSALNNMEKSIADSINKMGDMEEVDQVAMLKLQQKTSSYNNAISMMTNMLKSLSDTDKEVIRNT